MTDNCTRLVRAAYTGDAITVYQAYGHQVRSEKQSIHRGTPRIQLG